MGVLVPASSYQQSTIGQVVAKAATTLVQNTSTSLFTVSGGDVLVTAIYGKVTTAVAATASLTAKLVHTPSGGSAADLAAATVITSDAVGTFYTANGVAADVLSAQKPGGTEVPTVTYGAKSGGFILPAGTVGVTVSNHDPGTGAVAWTIAYIPLAQGATVAAA